MTTSLDEQINQLNQTIADIESQRSILGDEAVEASLKPIRQKLAILEALDESSIDELVDVPQRKRKLITLLYLDVVGSTFMTQNLDPEDNLEIMDNALLRLVEPIQEHGGRITRYTGDGFKAVFGDPIARENDPKQAIRAGLEIIDLSRILSQEIKLDWGIENFQVRIGIDTGLAAIGGQTEAEDTVKGKVVNLAKRIESAAPAGGLLISHNTYRHVRGIFNIKMHDPVSVKGFDEPIQVYIVESTKPHTFWLRGLEVEGIETQMVGREDELKYLQEAAFEAVENKIGKFITISGEAGIGKSRLLYEFQNWLDLLPQEIRLFQGRSRQETQYIPYALLRNMIKNRFDIQDNDPIEIVHQKVENGFGEIFGTDDNGLTRSQTIGQLLGFNFTDSPHIKGILDNPQKLRDYSMSFLEKYFKDLSKVTPVVIFLEDIHWGDDSSLDVFDQLSENLSQLGILTICLARNRLFERIPGWGEGKSYQFRINLSTLSEEESHTLVREILQLVETIPEGLLNLIVKNVEGNPFYLEELIKKLVEDGVIIIGDGQWYVEETRLIKFKVPPTLTGVLQARIDTLPANEKITLQYSSVVGQTFWDTILEQINKMDIKGLEKHEVSPALVGLLNKEMIYHQQETAFFGTKQYIFKHAMLRDVAYENVLKQLRMIIHEYVADWLIEHCGNREREFAGLISSHLERSGDIDRSTRYLIKAGDQARLTYAIAEAEHYYRSAVNLLIQQGKSELAARTLMKLGLVYTAAFDTEKTRKVYEEAFTLWSPIVDSEALELTKESSEILRFAIDEPPTIDPGLVSDDLSHFIVAQLFDGLVKIGQDNNVLPDIAVHWDIYEDGKRYIFHLRENAYWSDGNPVTASDFEFAWKRNLHPDLGSLSSLQLYVLENAQAFAEGDISDQNMIGVTALNNSTLEVRLKSQTSYLPHLLTQPISYPLPQWVIDEHGSKWTEPDVFITNGAYMLFEKEKDSRIVLKKNPFYHAKFPGNLIEVDCRIFSNYQSAIDHYSNNLVDGVSMINADPGILEYVRKNFSDELVAIPYPSVLYLAFRCDSTPFNDALVRKAFVHAVDRESLSDLAFQGQRTPALGGFVPPGMPAHSPGIGLSFNPRLAQKLLSEAGYPFGKGFPSVQLFHGRSSRGELVINFLQESWKKNLSLNLETQSIDDWRDFFERTRRDPAELTILGWSADFPDPDSMLRVPFHSAGGRNIERWHNPDFDNLVETAGSVTDQTQRINLYQKADRILVTEEAVVMPISYGGGRILIKPCVKLPSNLSIQFPFKELIVNR
jgi:ABC-type oligopeptide transport system substrate-binding subunit/class 3 adenylate cyclase